MRDTCRFIGCENDAIGIVKFTFGGRSKNESGIAEVEICQACLERAETEKPTATCWRMGRRLDIETIAWSDPH